jgi:ketosteroid isomerase-like protein
MTAEGYQHDGCFFARAAGGAQVITCMSNSAAGTLAIAVHGARCPQSPHKRRSPVTIPQDLAARIDRLEALVAIRQLASKYALAIDVRDLDAIVALYVDDVRAGADARGRPALRAVFDRVLRGFTTTAHQVQNHVIDFDDANHAQGLVTCRCEHEVATPAGPRWVIVQNLYHDRYQRVAGRWYFRARVQNRLYGTASDDPPVGPLKDRWPGSAPAEAPFHGPFASWREFWGEQPAAEGLAPWSADSNFVNRLRRSDKLPPLARHIARAHADSESSKEGNKP